MNENESDLGAFLAGFVIGGLVGAATALILAPQSGRATREKIAHFGNDLRQVSEDRIDQVRTTADTYSREYRDMATSILADTRSRAQHLADQAHDQMRIVLDAGKDQTQSTDNGIDASQG
jgi:gas vesicle protein